MRAIVEQIKFPAAIVALAGLVLLLDGWQKGWRGSAARRLLTNSREDVAWFIFNLSGAMRWATVALTFGVAYWLPHLLHWQPPVCHWPSWAQFLFAGATNEFLFYWVHRGMHRWGWFAHKLHHSPTEFNGITVFRTHPVEVAIEGPILSLPAALLGVQPGVIAAWTLLRMLHDMLIHSEIKWCPRWFGDYVICDGEKHAQHHSSLTEHYDSNYATLPVLDIMFGTYKATPHGRTPIGFVIEPDCVFATVLFFLVISLPALIVWLTGLTQMNIP